MSKNIQAIRGMNDILPEQTPNWQYVEHCVRETLGAYGYSEIRFPIVEMTDLFKRSIGEVTDIVEKEMYTFDDRNGDSLTLRPEGTAGCLRACLEHGLLHHHARRLWYYGPMFRHEKPQSGRYRQFTQLGVETYGMPGPDIDAELILLAERLWQRLGLQGKLQLQLNTLGSIDERLRYRERLVAYFKEHIAELDEIALRRLETNPLRILDSKNPAMAALIHNAPVLMEHLGDESLAHFGQLTETLQQLGVAYTVNPRLVRGLDYYSKTVFEWVTDELGAQGTVCAGGRYDSLVAQLGGKDNHAVGFALGMERLLALLETTGNLMPDAAPDIYLVRVGAAAERFGFTVAERFRDAYPGIKLLMNCDGGNFKSQFKKADKSGAAYALIIGDDEAAQQLVGIKDLRHGQEQQALPLPEALAHFQTLGWGRR